jgi:putative aldouronate transport system permease protein
MRQSTGEKLFGVFNMLVLGMVALLCLYPFIYTLTISLSTATEASREGFHFYPKEISLTSYKVVLSNPDIVTGFKNSVVRTVLGTILTLLATCVAAYPLSRREMPHRSLITFVIVFTMLFGGGMVPGYLLIKKLGLINTVWVLVVPGMLSAFNIIVVKNFFQSLPESLIESARMDGAGEWRILFQIFIPLSKPVLATVALWSAVAHWNAWFDAMLFITDDSKQVLQTFLQRIVIESGTRMMELGINNTAVLSFTAETIKAATIIVTILPIICVYPFVQKYFIKGIMLGGVKE